MEHLQNIAKTKKHNLDYRKILDRGFDIQIMGGRDGNSSMYLMKDGVRQGIRVHFKSNNQSNESLMRLAIHVREFTHLGQALKEILKTIIQNEDE